MNKEISLYLNDLWFYDLTVNNFSKVNLDSKDLNNPNNRGGHSFICDEKTSKIILFAGKTENNRYNDLFEYNISKYKLYKQSVNYLGKLNH